MKKGGRRVLLAAILAPIGPALLFGAFFAWRSGIWLTGAFMAALFYTMMALFALPLLLVLRLTNHSNAFTCTMTGTLTATTLIAALIVLASGGTADADPGYVDNSLATVFLQLALFATLGGMTGASFWKIAPVSIVEGQPPERSPASSR